MPHAWLLATRNWRVRPGRAAGTLVAISIGVATVVWVTSSYESVRQSLADRVIDRWIGRSHISIESSLGHWGEVDPRMIDEAEKLDGVLSVTARLRRRMYLAPIAGAGEANQDIDVDAVGIEPHTEYAFRNYGIHGERIVAGEHGAAVVEASVARELGVEIGDAVLLRGFSADQTLPLRIVGTFDAQRVAKFQKPMVLVELSELQNALAENVVTIIDVMFADPTPERLEMAAGRLRAVIREQRLGYQVITTTAQLNQINEAQQYTQSALMLVSSVALLTALFIIATTMSMGMVERIRQMGMLRCVGATRGQLVWQVFAEIGPLGCAGLALGVPVGLVLTMASSWLVPEYIQSWSVSVPGLIVALVGGLLTTAGGALLPAIQASRVTPLSATRPDARPAPRYLPAVAFAVGVAMIAGHAAMVSMLDPVRWAGLFVGLIGTALLYVGYAMITPLAVQVLGALAVQVAARVLRLKPALLNDQVGREAWRGAGICCGLMVGLSLLISVVVHAESIRMGWDFPKRIAEAFVWTARSVPSSYADVVRRLPGIAECTVVNDFLVDLGESRSRLFKMFKIKSTFVAGEPDVFLNMAKLSFLEGDEVDARAKLRRGGYILVPPEASRAFDLHLGDKVPMTASGRTAEFEVAGVIQSPALDIAVTYFQAESYMMVAAANSVLGTMDDARKCFGIDAVSMFLMNFAMPPSLPPTLFEMDNPPPIDDALVARQLHEWGERLIGEEDLLDRARPLIEAWLTDPSKPFDRPAFLAPYRTALEYVAERWHERTPQQRWDMFLDRLIMHRVLRTINRPEAVYGSLRELKQQIDDDIRSAAMLLAAIPIVALLVAAIGVGNLMTANVLSRTREIGILRSAGATQWQIARLVLGEALVLGGIGSAAGLALGLHAAYSGNELTKRAIGFAPSFALPTWDVSIGILLTVGICVLAGLLPARRASRSNIIAAIRSA